MFWILIFPAALSTFLNLALSNIENAIAYDTINVAIVDKESFDADFVTMLSSLEYDNGKKMFEIEETNTEIANELLLNEDIVGIISSEEDNIILTIQFARLEETILKSVLDQYVQSKNTIITIMTQTGGTADINELITALNSQKDYLLEESINTKENADAYIIYFYAIIGMAVLYGGYLGTNEITTIQANLSPTGARISSGPIKRYKMLLIKMGAANLVHFIAMLILIAYLSLVLGIQFVNLPLTILVTAMGSATGVWLGAFIAIALRKASINIKIAITSMTGVVGGMLAGMMSPTIKYWVMTEAPILGYINPANLINDALYSLYFYQTTERYFINLFALGIILTFLILGTILMFRRDNYESI
jgi:ABC-2 type transport system permease protein